jgi:hypothetical protein
MHDLNEEIIDLPFESDIDEFNEDDIEKEIAREIKRSEREPEKVYQADGEPLWIGIDAEWTQSVDTPSQNDILSVQFAAYTAGDIQTKIVYTQGKAKEDRPGLSKVLSQFILELLGKNIIAYWPREVVLIGFFLRIDLAAFADLSTFKHQIDSAGGSVSTIGHAATLPSDFSPHDLTAFKSKRVIGGEFLFPESWKVSFVDLNKHVPIGTTLAQIGGWLGEAKLELPSGYDKARMDVFLAERRPEFEAYALRDAEITVKFYVQLYRFSLGPLGLNKVSPTATGMAVKLFLKSLSDEERQRLFGLEVKREEIWNYKTGRLFTKQERVPNAERSIHDAFVSSCYHGGRNECFMMGVTDAANWNDFDIRGAYTTGMTGIRPFDYERARVSYQLDELLGDKMSFARVVFRFPEHTRFPCLPVEAGNRGLYFPLEGTSYCTGLELEVAVKMGAEIEVKHGVIVPWQEDERPLFLGFVQLIRKLRGEFKKGSLFEIYAKLLGNSLYGKTAQGLKEKTVFDTKGLRSVKLPPSEITNPFIAAYTTGFVRAVMGELLAGIPAERRVVSVTTDGFLTDASDKELDTSGPVCTLFQRLCDQVEPGSHMLEVKHQVKQLIAMKTRGQLTLEADGTGPIILAKAGVSPPVPKEEHNEYMVNLYLTRTPESKTVIQPFTSLREQWTNDADVVRGSLESRLNLEFDMKRELHSPVLRSARGYEHLSCETRPWRTVEEGLAARARFDGWRVKHNLKTLDDWDSWDENHGWAKFKTMSKSALRLPTEGLIELVRKIVVRAIARGEFGCDKQGKTYKALAKEMTALGYKTTETDFKNARRLALTPHCLPYSERVIQALNRLLKIQPSLIMNDFIYMPQVVPV